MSCGIPAVVGSGSGFQEMADRGAGVVANLNSGELAQALRQLLDAPELRQQMGARARHLVQKEFAWDRIGERMVELYESVVRGHRRRNEIQVRNNEYSRN